MKISTEFEPPPDVPEGSSNSFLGGLRDEASVGLCDDPPIPDVWFGITVLVPERWCIVDGEVGDGMAGDVSLGSLVPFPFATAPIGGGSYPFPTVSGYVG